MATCQGPQERLSAESATMCSTAAMPADRSSASPALRVQRARLAGTFQGIPDSRGRAPPCGAAVCGAERVAGAVGAACRAVAMVFAEGLGGRARRCAVAPRPGASGRRLDRLDQPAAKRSGTLGLAQEHRAVYAVRRGVLAADHRRPPRAGVQPPPPRQTETKRMILCPTIEKQNVPFFPSGK